jgi:hypothetical protein
MPPTSLAARIFGIRRNPVAVILRTPPPLSPRIRRRIFRRQHPPEISLFLRSNFLGFTSRRPSSPSFFAQSRFLAAPRRYPRNMSATTLAQLCSPPRFSALFSWWIQQHCIHLITS